MFEDLRMQVARAIWPKKSAPPRNLSSFNTPGMAVYTEMTVRKATREGYKMSLYVYRCVRTIVQAVSGVPWAAMEDGKIIEKHPFTQLMRNPNPEMSGQDLIEFLIAHLKLAGNALWQPIMVGGKPRELWVAMPDLIQPIPSKQAGVWLDGWQINETGGRQSIVPPETFIHFMQFDPGNPYWGIGDLQAAARTVDTDNEAQDTQKISMQNRGVPSGVFQYTDELNQIQWEEQNRRVQELFLEKTKRRAPWVLGAGATWQPMSFSPVEMDFLESRKNNKTDIATAFGLDPWWLGDREHSTYNNVVEAKKALYETVGIPLLDDLKATMQKRFGPMYGGIEIGYDLSNIPALRKDFSEKVDQAQKLWAMGIPFKQINDKLEMGFEAFESWDVGFLPFSVQPAGVIEQVSEAGPDEEEGETDEQQQEEEPKRKSTEEQKALYWKRVDSRRMAYWTLVQKKVLKLYQAEGKQVQQVIASVSDDKMIVAIQSVIKSGQSDWIKLLTIINRVIIEDFGKRVEIPKSRKWVFDPFSDAIRKWLKAHVLQSVTSILETNINDAKRVIQQGVEDGLSRVQIGSQLRQFYEDRSFSKAMTVARTETGAAAGFGQHEAAKQSGVMQRKRWLSSRDDRVRDAHAAMDGEERALDEPYSNGLQYPGDPSGPAEEVIMCRCVEQYFTE